MRKIVAFVQLLEALLKVGTLPTGRYNGNCFPFSDDVVMGFCGYRTKWGYADVNARYERFLKGSSPMTSR